MCLNIVLTASPVQVLDPVGVAWQKMKASQQSKIDRFKVGPVAIVNRPANNSAEHPSVFATRHLNNLAVIAGTCVAVSRQGGVPYHR